MELTKRETATILASLRWLQEGFPDNAAQKGEFTIKENWPDHFAEVNPLNEAEIDVLCEKINLDIDHGRISLRTHTIAQFTADYFAADRDEVIDYSELDGGICWNEYVAWIAQGGNLLEDAMQESIARGEHSTQWYDILEAATFEIHRQFVKLKSEPNWVAMKTSFEQIIKSVLD